MAETRTSSHLHLSLVYAALCLWLQNSLPGGLSRFASSPLRGDLERLLTMETTPHTTPGRGTATSVPSGAVDPSGSSHTESSTSSGASHFSSGSGSGSLKDDQLEGGYTYDPVLQMDEKYECPICFYVQRDPTQTMCGHRFCETCIKKWMREKTKPGYLVACPICSEGIGPGQLFRDNFAKREILMLRVRCPHSQAGCEAIMEIKHITKHLDTCDYVILLCPNGCARHIMRMNMQDHLESTCEHRLSDCPICHTPIRIQQKALHLQQDCPMVELTCELCSERIQRSKLKVHMKDLCPKALVDCSFCNLGCATKIERDQLETHLHLSIQCHLRLLAESIVSLRASLHHPAKRELLSYLGPQSDPLVSSLAPGVDSVSTTDSGLGVTRTQTQCANPTGSFLTHPTRSHRDLSSSSGLYQRLDSLSLSIPPAYLDQSNPFSPHELEMSGASPRRTMHQQLSRQLSLGFVEERLTQRSSGSSTPQQSSVVMADLSRLQEQIQEQASTMAQQSQKLNDLLIRNRTLSEKVDEQQATIQQLEEQFHDYTLQNCAGTFIWKVQNYYDKKIEAQRGSRTVIHSPGFYSSMYGYKLCVRLNLNGVESATGTHISLFVHFMQGEYDDILDWPFSGRISLSILDQTNASQYHQHITETLLSKPTLAAFQRPNTHRNHKGFGYVEFSPLNVIEGSSPCYRKNDTIFIKVKVDTN